MVFSLWVYKSPIGPLYIRRLPNSTYGLIYNGIVWESSNTPEEQADDVYMQCTGCFEWDSFNDSQYYVPKDLSEWEKI